MANEKVIDLDGWKHALQNLYPSKFLSFTKIDPTTNQYFNSYNRIQIFNQQLISDNYQQLESDNFIFQPNSQTSIYGLANADNASQLFGSFVTRYMFDGYVLEYGNIYNLFQICNSQASSAPSRPIRVKFSQNRLYGNQDASLITEFDVIVGPYGGSQTGFNLIKWNKYNNSLPFCLGFKNGTLYLSVDMTNASSNITLTNAYTLEVISNTPVDINPEQALAGTQIISSLHQLGLNTISSSDAYFNTIKLDKVYNFGASKDSYSGLNMTYKEDATTAARILEVSTLASDLENSKPFIFKATNTINSLLGDTVNPWSTIYGETIYSNSNSTSGFRNITNTSTTTSTGMCPKLPVENSTDYFLRGDATWQEIASIIPTTLPASDVYSWAKQPNKPSYEWSEISNKPTIPIISKITDSNLLKATETYYNGSELTGSMSIVYPALNVNLIDLSNQTLKMTANITMVNDYLFSGSFNRVVFLQAVAQDTINGSLKDVGGIDFTYKFTGEEKAGDVIKYSGVIDFPLISSTTSWRVRPLFVYQGGSAKIKVTDVKLVYGNIRPQVSTFGSQGVVVNGSKVTDKTGLTPVPIINGVPYYKESSISSYRYTITDWNMNFTTLSNYESIPLGSVVQIIPSSNAINAPITSNASELKGLLLITTSTQYTIICTSSYPKDTAPIFYRHSSGANHSTWKKLESQGHTHDYLPINNPTFTGVITGPNYIADTQMNSPIYNVSNKVDFNTGKATISYNSTTGFLEIDVP